MASEDQLPPSGDLTVLLRRAKSGDSEAQQAILPRVYEELLVLARAKMRGRPSHHTLQPTALVHEAYLRSLATDRSFENRRHFFFIAAQAMRDILVEHARRKAAAKRGGDQDQVAIDDVAVAIQPPSVDMLALQDALSELENRHPRHYEVVMLRYFAGLTAPDCAEVLDVGVRTVERDWRFARAFLKDFMQSA